MKGLLNLSCSEVRAFSDANQSGNGIEGCSTVFLGIRLSDPRDGNTFIWSGVFCANGRDGDIIIGTGRWTSCSFLSSTSDVPKGSEEGRNIRSGGGRIRDAECTEKGDDRKC